MTAAVAVLALTGGCKPKGKEISSLQHKEATSQLSAAQFALQRKHLARAAGLPARAVELSWEAGKVWVDLASAGVRLGQKDAAQPVYQAAFKADSEAAAKSADEEERGPEAGPRLEPGHVLVWLGRFDEARSVLTPAQKKLPDRRAVRACVHQKQMETMIADLASRLIAL